MEKIVVPEQRVVHLPVAESLAGLPEELTVDTVEVRIDRSRPGPGTATTGSRRFPATWSGPRASGAGYVEVGPLSAHVSLVEVTLGRGVGRVVAEALRNTLEGRPPQAPAARPRPAPTPRLVAAGLLLVLVATSAAAFQAVTQSQPVTVEMATARYRAAVAESAAAEAPPAAQPTAVEPVPLPQPAGTATAADEPAVEPDIPAPPPPVAPEPEGPAPEPEGRTLPQPGVYRYATTGWEELSMPGSRRSFPAETAQTLTHTECGFKVSWQPLEERRDAFELCTAADWDVLAAVDTYRSFFGRAHEQSFACAQTRAAAGTVWSVRCTDAGTVMHVSAETRGEEVLSVAGQPVETVRMLMDSRLEGDTSGTRVAHMWFDRTGLLVRTEVTSDLQVQGPFGQVRYQEEHSLHLLDLVARQ